MPARKKTTTSRKTKTSAKSTQPRRLPVQNITSRKAAKGSSLVSKTENTSRNYKQYLKNPRLWVGVAVVVLAVLVYMYKGLFVAATVNGQPITRFAVISSLEKQSGKQALNNLIVESLVSQEADRQHITVSQSDIDAQMKKIEDQLKSQGVTLDSALAARGLSRSDLTDQLKLQIYLNKMVGSTVKVSDSDVQSYIDKNQDSLPKDLSDADLRSQVKQQLEQQQVQNKTQALVSDLQKKAQISYFVSY